MKNILNKSGLNNEKYLNKCKLNNEIISRNKLGLNMD